MTFLTPANEADLLLAACAPSQRQDLARLQLDALLSQAPFGFVFLDRDLRFLRINDQLAHINGYSVAEHIGKTVTDIVPALEATLREVTSQIMATGQPVLDKEFTGATSREPGVSRTWNESWYPVRDEGGEIIGFSAMVVDITERKRAQAALRESEQHFRALAEASGQIPYRMSADWSTMLPMDGRGVFQSLTTPLANWAWMDQYLPRDEHARVLLAVQAAVDGQTHFELEHRLLGPDGSIGWVRSCAVPIWDDNQVLVSWFGAAADISERKRIEQNLTEATAAAEKANRAKSEFLSNMSHELRTPLNSILGFAQLLEFGAPEPTPTQAQSLQHIIRGGWYLLDLINDLLDLAAIESGQMLLAHESFSLTELMHECRDMIESQALERAITMTFPQVEPSGCVFADRTRVKQVVINLLSNAIKYNRAQGSVSLELALSRPDAMRVSVRDTGEGLAPEKLAQLFQPFNRLGREAGPHQGTGIGLVMSRRLVELMGGAIGVESTVGVGSVFWFEMKWVTAEPAASV